jgi:hypothetical protein
LIIIFLFDLFFRGRRFKVSYVCSGSLGYLNLNSTNVASKLRLIFLKICGQIPAHVYITHVPHCDFARQGGASAGNIRADTTTQACKTL